VELATTTTATASTTTTAAAAYADALNSERTAANDEIPIGGKRVDRIAATGRFSAPCDGD
jgi:hypothetical protein